MAKRNVTARGLRARLQEEFAKHPGVQMFMDGLAESLGVEERQVQSGISNWLRDEPDCGLRVDIRGRAWTYKPASKDGRCFEEIGTARDGTIVIQDDHGKLYRATEL